MRILTVVFNLEKGGTQRAAQNFAEAYLGGGHDSRVLVIKPGGVRESELRDRGVPMWAGLDDRTADEIQGWNPGVIHLHSLGLKMADVHRLVTASPDAVVVETNVFSWPSPWVAEVDVSFQLSPWCEWLYVSRGGLPARSAVVPNPIRTEGFRRASAEAIDGFRRKHGVAADEILLGRVGQAFDRKWSPLLLDAFEHARNAGIKAKLVVVNAPATILDRVRRSPHAAHVIVIDQIIGDEPMSVAYSAMDVFVHVADQGESFGIVLTEAMLCETPCLTFSTPWEDNSQPGVVGHMQGGLVATTRQGFYQALERLCRDAGLRRKLGQRGREKVLQQYDSAAVAAEALRHARGATRRGGDGLATRAAVIAHYKDAIDHPSWASLSCIGRMPRLKLTKYTTGYEPWRNLASRFWGGALRPMQRLIGGLRAGGGGG